MKRLMVVEDEHSIAQSLATILELKGFQVEVALNGDEARQKLLAGCQVDLILLDLMMPVLDGYGLRRWQLAEARFSQIPVIILSADSIAERRIVEQGLADTFIPKPFSARQVIEAVEQALGPLSSGYDNGERESRDKK